MSQPRRRRRRRGRGGSGAPRGGGAPAERQPRADQAAPGTTGRRKRRRRGGRSGGGSSSPASSEDLVRGPVRERPERLTRDPDGTTLEQVIGELQSNWGVPQFPQEFKITLRVAGESRGGGDAVEAEEVLEDPADTQARTGNGTDRPRREKAPAPPRLAVASGEDGAVRPKRRRRARRRRGKGPGSSPNSNGGPPAPA